MNGKGSRTRPMNVTRKQWSDNWDKAFGKNPDESDHRESFGFKCGYSKNGKKCGAPAIYDDRGFDLSGQPFLIAFCKDHPPRRQKSQ